LSGIGIWLFFPDTKGLALEEIATIFGDQDEMALYEEPLDIPAEIEKGDVGMKA
jgi:hypothetical protein